MRNHLFAFALAFLLTLTGCETAPGGSGASASPARPRSAPEPAWVSLERTATGEGTAPGPVYVVTLYEDGNVVFEGHAMVKKKGTFTRTIPRAGAKAVFDTIPTLNLAEREKRYDIERMGTVGDSLISRTASREVPWDILRVRTGGRLIRIDGLFFAPQDILALKALIERTVGLEEFLGEPHERQR